MTEICTVSFDTMRVVDIPKRLIFRVVDAADVDGHAVLQIDVQDSNILPSLTRNRFYAADITLLDAMDPAFADTGLNTDWHGG